jgi:hypothetical protein
MILRTLKAEALEGNPSAQMAIAFHNEPAPGLLRQLRAGPDGVLLIAGGRSILIPTDELFALAQTHDPAFAPPKSGALPAPRAPAATHARPPRKTNANPA